VHSPNVLKVVVKRSGKTRRAKLFYLRDRVGKATRLSEKSAATSKKAGGTEPVDAAVEAPVEAAE
jgi:hypothetical protein